MRRTTRVGLAGLAATAVALLLTGCISANAGSAAEDAFTERLTADYGDWVEELRIDAHNTLPFMGDANGSVVLRADTPPDVFAEVVQFVESYQGPGSFAGSGVQANGVGVCFGDPQVDAKQQLRDALHAASAALAGEWRCPPRPGDVPLPYSGTLEAFDGDIALLRSLGTGTGLELTASLTEPDGSVSGPLDEVPGSVAATLRAIDGVSEVLRFQLEGAALTVAIAATADPAPAQSAADAVAGPDLVAQVVLGSLDPAEQARYAELGPLVDDLRALPGVTHVEASPGAVTLRTLDPLQVTAIHDAALAHPEFTELALSIEVGDAGWTMGASRYFRPADGQSQHIADFAAIVATDGVTQVVLNEAGGGRERWLSVEVDWPIMDVVRLKGVVPMGVAAQLASSADDLALRFQLADQLRAEDVSEWQDEVDLEVFAAAWNAAP